jgi:hypothetical protein
MIPFAWRVKERLFFDDLSRNLITLTGMPAHFIEN